MLINGSFLPYCVILQSNSPSLTFCVIGVLPYCLATFCIQISHGAYIWPPSIGQDMSALIKITILSLLLLCGAGYYGTWYILLNNGSTDYMSHIRDVGPRLLPGTNEALKTVYIGIPAIDYQLTILTLFFWELVDGSNPSASLFCFHFATQVACGWGLLMIEGLRRGHRWKLVSLYVPSRDPFPLMLPRLILGSTGTLGVLVQNAAYAIIVPTYLVLYLLTSPLVSSRRTASFLVERQSTVMIPISLALGYVLPAVLMSLPAPSLITSEQKQTLMALWQMFPVWVAIFQATLPSITMFINRYHTRPSKNTDASELSAMRWVYLILLVTAGIGQISTFTLLATSKWFPTLFAPESRGVFNPSNVLLPIAISPSTKMPSIGTGAFLLLQYDEIVGSTSMVIFASVLHILARQNSSSHRSVGSSIVLGLAALICTGPLGYAVACVWARDEMIIQESQEVVKKSR